jgi:hypothetical protein
MTEMKLTLTISFLIGLVHFSIGHLDEVAESPLEVEYRRLYDLTDDKSGLESIRVLHKQLDDDNDGTIEPAETCDFIRGDLVRFYVQLNL